MTLMLGLGMATASFAGTIANTDAKAEAAPKDCAVVALSCATGTVTYCEQGATYFQALQQAMIMEETRCPSN